MPSAVTEKTLESLRAHMPSAVTENIRSGRYHVHCKMQEARLHNNTYTAERNLFEVPARNGAFSAGKASFFALK
eukprot:2875982-Alexandrium_andersonii.AAC.1